jgi:hypothetical protein
MLRAYYYLSLGNRYYAVFQRDGNFVLYDTPIFNHAVWASGINGRRNYLRMQNDGNLVIYDTSKHPVWATGSNGKGVPPYRLVMLTDRNLVIFDGAGVPTWASGTHI